MILVLNAGSSSLKLAVFDHQLRQCVDGLISNIGGRGALKTGETRAEIFTHDHTDALDQLLDALIVAGLPLNQITAVAHRVVHGGRRLIAPTLLTPDVLRQIQAMVPLAPLHNPPALAGIAAVTDKLPLSPQYVSFDTAFHATQPDLATTYALPAAQREKGIRRYGFHGLSYAGMVRQFGANLPDRLLALHLGAGVSLCAIKGGKSIATSMGYSPLSGPTMATRTGDIDGMAVLRIAQEEGFETANRLLNTQSGLLGLSGISGDMRTLLADESPQAQFAIDHFVYTIVQQAGGLIAAMQGVDAVAFTGGIGENSTEIRDRIMARLAWLGPLPMHIVPADEERQIAIDAFSLI